MSKQGAGASVIDEVRLPPRDQVEQERRDAEAQLGGNATAKQALGALAGKAEPLKVGRPPDMVATLPRLDVADADARAEKVEIVLGAKGPEDPKRVAQPFLVARQTDAQMPVSRRTDTGVVEVEAAPSRLAQDGKRRGVMLLAFVGACALGIAIFALTREEQTAKESDSTTPVLAKQASDSASATSTVPVTAVATATSAPPVLTNSAEVDAPKSGARSSTAKTTSKSAKTALETATATHTAPSTAATSAKSVRPIPSNWIPEDN
jgi:hypothetical protein